MTTRQFQTVFYIIIGLCILTIVIAFKSFEFMEVDIAVSWTIKYFALPILIIIAPCCHFIYLKFLKQQEAKEIENVDSTSDIFQNIPFDSSNDWDFYRYNTFNYYFNQWIFRRQQDNKT